MRLAPVSEPERLWTAAFWQINFINLLVGMSVYMLMPLWPALLEEVCGASFRESGLVVALFGLGMFLPGPFCNYWLDTHRRKAICWWATAALAGTTFAVPWPGLPLGVLVLLHMLRGMAFGVFQIALGSTLLIDLSHTRRRTQAAHVYYWFSRFAWSLGPAVGLLALRFGAEAFPASLACVLVALVLLLRLHVPFRTPLEPRRLSADRFWLGRGRALVLGLLPVTVSAGLVMAGNRSFEFYGLLMVGFLLALTSHLVVFANADRRAEVTAGLIFLFASFLLQLTRDVAVIDHFASVLAGWGLGLVGSRYLLMLIRVSEHCERGTAQSTYMLCWEGGLCLGFFIGCCCIPISLQLAYGLGLLLTAVALGYYLLVAYAWFLTHCRR